LAKLGQLQDELIRVSRTDELTGAFCRRHGSTLLAQEMDRYRATGVAPSVGLVDIDFFKKFNDTWGHIAGDDVLVAVTRALTESIRPTDTLIRWGGEEFLVVMPATDLDTAYHVVDVARQRLASTIIEIGEDGTPVSVNISGGVAMLQPNDTRDTMVDRADRGLYAAKENGRNNIVDITVQQRRRAG
jgi:diguanylate cyclase (GGDEF)-like protein